MAAEHGRLEEARTQSIPWKKWGSCLSERQWGTVREDYSENGDAWNFFTQPIHLASSARPQFFAARVAKLSHRIHRIVIHQPPYIAKGLVRLEIPVDYRTYNSIGVLDNFLARSIATWRREWDSNPRYPFGYTRSPGACLQPLGHLSFFF